MSRKNNNWPQGSLFGDEISSILLCSLSNYILFRVFAVVYIHRCVLYFT